jgi:hypothetical protein
MPSKRTLLPAATIIMFQPQIELVRMGTKFDVFKITHGIGQTY